MHPIKFAGSNKVFTKPDSMTDEECESLSVHDNGQELSSHWKPEPEELEQLYAGGSVVLSVIGRSQPVVRLSVCADDEERVFRSLDSRGTADEPEISFVRSLDSRGTADEPEIGFRSREEETIAWQWGSCMGDGVCLSMDHGNNVPHGFSTGCDRWTPMSLIPKPEYPHTAWVREIEAEFEARALTELEALGYTEALMFERMIEESIPALNRQLEDSKSTDPDSLDARNATVFLAVAMKLANGLAEDVIRIREKTARVKLTTTHFMKNGQPS